MPENLILVHSFPTNSYLLEGLVDFLSDSLVVHFVDLPGFTRQSPPLERISIDSYAAFLERHIERLGLERYLLGGISFGHLVVSRTRVTSSCRAILAMEPFLGLRSLRMRPLKRRFLASMMRAIVTLGLSKSIYYSDRWRKLQLSRGEPAHRLEVVQREIDPTTFFATASTLLTYDEPLEFHDLPHVLLINRNDRTIDAEDVIAVFHSNVDQLLVVETSVDHYPDEPTKRYFQENISAEQIARILQFLSSRS